MGKDDEGFGRGLGAGFEAVVPKEILTFFRDLAPDVVAYLDRKRADRRHVFDVAFAAAKTSEEKTDLALAFLDGGGTSIEDVAQAVAKKAAPS